jgi:hypothetical protein
MARRKKPASIVAQVVRGEILPTITVDCSGWIDNPEEWTRVSLHPEAVVEPTTSRKGHARATKQRRKR